LCIFILLYLLQLTLVYDNLRFIVVRSLIWQVNTASTVALVLVVEIFGLVFSSKPNVLLTKSMDFFPFVNFKSMLKSPPRTIVVSSKPSLWSISYFGLYCMKFHSMKSYSSLSFISPLVPGVMLSEISIIGFLFTYISTAQIYPTDQLF